MITFDELKVTRIQCCGNPLRRRGVVFANVLMGNIRGEARQYLEQPPFVFTEPLWPVGLSILPLLTLRYFSNWAWRRSGELSSAAGEERDLTLAQLECFQIAVRYEYG